MEHRPKKLLAQVRDAIRLKHYSIRTEASYVTWITRFMLFHHKRRPDEMARAEIEAFLTHLAVQQKVAASTQKQALSALLFLYRDVFKKPLDFPSDAIRAKKPKRLPAVLTNEGLLAQSAVPQKVSPEFHASSMRVELSRSVICLFPPDALCLLMPQLSCSEGCPAGRFGGH
jgi:site-specific recombinase XerD